MALPHLACCLHSCWGTRVRVPAFPDLPLMGSALNRKMPGRQQDRPQGPLTSLENVAHTPVVCWALGSRVVKRGPHPPLWEAASLARQPPMGAVWPCTPGTWGAGKESWVRRILAEPSPGRCGSWGPQTLLGQSSRGNTDFTCTVLKDRMQE